VKPPAASHPLPVSRQSGHRRCFWSPPARRRRGLFSALHRWIDGKVPLRFTYPHWHAGPTRRPFERVARLQQTLMGQRWIGPDPV
jgi:hypothetical protein